MRQSQIQRRASDLRCALGFIGWIGHVRQS
ncbi:UNVERIFIED_ORG: hypothetical protein OKW15_003464 [Pseudomonas reinekei]|nr:hypothetical protein [Pseudomonas reinekei]